MNGSMLIELAGALVCGLAFSITPIPYTPLIFINGLSKLRGEGAPMSSVLIAAVPGITLALLPLLFIVAAFDRGMATGLVFTASMYAAAMRFNKPERPVQEDDES